MTDRVERLYERLLVLRCQTGDAAAFAELVARYGPRLGYYLRKLLGGLDGAEDLLQEAWIDVFRHIPNLRDPAAFSAWLYRIAPKDGTAIASVSPNAILGKLLDESQTQYDPTKFQYLAGADITLLAGLSTTLTFQMYATPGLTHIHQKSCKTLIVFAV